jgi:hypothetical protein
MTVKHLLELKGGNLWIIDPDATVLDALAKMAEKDIGSLVVMTVIPGMSFSKAKGPPPRWSGTSWRET